MRFDHGRIETFIITASCLTDQIFICLEFPIDSSHSRSFQASELVQTSSQAIGEGSVSEANVQHSIDVLGKGLLCLVFSKLKDEDAFADVPSAPFW